MMDFNAIFSHDVKEIVIAYLFGLIMLGIVFGDITKCAFAALLFSYGYWQAKRNGVQIGLTKATVKCR